MRSKTDLEPA